MKKKIAAAVIVLTAIITVINIAFFVRDSFFFNLNDLPSGEFLYSSMSPDGNKTVRIYHVDSSLGSAIRGELISFDENNNRESKNIFWYTGVDNAVTGWVDDNVISINSIMLDTSKDESFDSRKELITDNPALAEKQQNAALQ